MFREIHEYSRFVATLLKGLASSEVQRHVAADCFIAYNAKHNYFQMYHNEHC